MAECECIKKSKDSRLFGPNFINKEEAETELSHNMSAKVPKIAFFRYFSSLNEGNLKFKEPPWKQHI